MCEVDDEDTARAVAVVSFLVVRFAVGRARSNAPRPARPWSESPRLAISCELLAFQAFRWLPSLCSASWRSPWLFFTLPNKNAVHLYGWVPILHSASRRSCQPPLFLSWSLCARVHPDWWALGDACSAGLGRARPSPATAKVTCASTRAWRKPSTRAFTSSFRSRAAAPSPRVSGCLIGNGQVPGQGFAAAAAALTS